MLFLSSLLLSLCVVCILFQLRYIYKIVSRYLYIAIDALFLGISYLPF